MYKIGVYEVNSLYFDYIRSMGGMNMKLSLYSNAIDFIEKGIDDFIQGEEVQENWFFKYAIINISQGVELLLKHILREKHELFIYKDIDEERPKKTVDFSTAIKRINNVYDIKISPKQKDILIRLRDIRNDYVHYEVKIDNYHYAAAIISETFPIIDQLLRTYLNTKLIDEVSEEIWEEFIKIERIHRDYYKELKSKYNLIKLGNEVLFCASCRMKSLITIDKTVKCVYCDKQYSSLEEAIAQLPVDKVKIQFIEGLINEKKLQSLHCPECRLSSIVFSEELEEFLCLYCNENTLFHDDIIVCSHCLKTSGVIVRETDRDGIIEQYGVCLNCQHNINPDSCDYCGEMSFHLNYLEIDDYDSILDNGAPERVGMKLCDYCYYQYKKRCNTRYSFE